MKKYSIFISIMFLICFLSIVGCVTTSSRITDENLNRIAVCTGGLGEEYGLVAKIQAEIDKTKKGGGVNADINYKEAIKGAIFTDKDLSEQTKKEFYDKYITCFFKLMGEPKVKLDIPRAYVLDEKHIKGHENNEPRFELIKPRQDVQYEYRQSSDLLMGIIFEVEGFETNGNKVSLSGDITIIVNNREIAKAPIPRIQTISEWEKRPVAERTGAEKIMMFMGYGEQSLGRSIPFLIVIDDFQNDEVRPGEASVKITVKDELSNQDAENTLRLKFKRI